MQTIQWISSGEARIIWMSWKIKTAATKSVFRDSQIWTKQTKSTIWTKYEGIDIASDQNQSLWKQRVPIKVWFQKYQVLLWSEQEILLQEVFENYVDLR